MNSALPVRHMLLALAVVAVWGTNFVVIRVGLDHLPPLIFASLRFFLVCIPAVFFVRRPNVPWSNLATYGLFIGTFQFSLLFMAMRSEISPGLASLVIQMQVFFTIGLSIWLTGERVRPFQWFALLLAVSGIVVIGANTDATTTPLGVGMVLLAALSWAIGNMAAKRSGVTSLLPYIVWGSLFSVPPLLALSLLIEGPAAIAAGLRHADLTTWAAVVWQTLGNTLFGYAVWGWLLSRHPAATITPMALLVPVFGMTTSAFLLGEPLPGWKILAALLVLSGLAFGILYPRWADRRASVALPGPDGL